MSQEKSLYGVIDQIRLCFNAMASLADETHADIGISAAMRAVLERLARAGPQTVPAMARARNVSRQHVQKLVDALGEAGLIDLRENPAHKRSPLVALTPQGTELFARIQGREEAIVSDLAARLADRDLAGTARTLRAIAGALRDLREDRTVRTSPAG